jgi:O-antigen/teichoic acid export membrane protein
VSEIAAPLAVDEVRSRGAEGAALLGARSALIYTFGIGANLLLAWLLTPRDFGIVALGTVLLVLGGFVSDAGFGAALIQRRAEPERIELQAVLGVQLALTTAIAVAFTAAAAPFGEVGLVMAVMVASLPLRILRVPSAIVLERRLDYRVIALADVVEALTFYGWAIGAVALGMGVWGVATAAVVRSLVGSAVVIARGPLGVMAPRWSWRDVRPLVGFGARFQGTAVLVLLREQAVAVGVAAVGGLATLGVWNLAWRVLQVPNVLLMAVARVAFPVMSRLRDAGEDPRPVLERGVATLAAVTGVVVVALVAVGPALPAIVGDDWGDVPAVLLWAGLALLISAPVAVATMGFLFASDDAGAIATATVVSAGAWLGVGLPLLPEYGAPAVGVGFVVGGLLNAALLGRRAGRRTGARVLRGTAPPTAVAMVAAAAGWLAAREIGEGLAGGAAGVAVAEAILLAGLALVARPALADARTLAARALRTLRGSPSIPVA